jgi:hypothetical protein
MNDFYRLKELEKLAAAAPWGHYDNDFDGYIANGIRDAEPDERTPFNCKKVCGKRIVGGEPSEGRVEADDPNVQLIILSRNLLPKFIELVDAANNIRLDIWKTVDLNVDWSYDPKRETNAISVIVDNNNLYRFIGALSSLRGTDE